MTFDSKLSIVDRSGKIDGVGLVPEQIGTLKTWRQFSKGQWLFLCIAVLEFLFTVYAGSLCVKNKSRFRIIFSTARGDTILRKVLN